MKAVVYHGRNDLRIEEVPKPSVGDDEALIRPRALSICGSDLSAFKKGSARRTPPLIMGHEAAGDVVEVGQNVQNVTVGDRVAVQPLQFCGECVYCHEGRYNLCLSRAVLGIDFPGAYAEYFKVPERLVYTLPDDLSYEYAALTEPLAVILHAVNQAQKQSLNHVLIIGAGMMGLILLITLKSRGTKQVVIADINNKKLQLAKQIGADLTVYSAESNLEQAIAKDTEDIGADVVFDAVGLNSTLVTAMNCAKRGGKVVIIGTSQQNVAIDMHDIVFKELEIMAAYVSSTEFPDAIQWLASGRIHLDPIIHIKAPLFQAQSVFEQLADERELRIKAILTQD
jgi:L-iditol 2-dehydrogenase